MTAKPKPEPAYRDFAGVFPDPYKNLSGWHMRYRMKSGGRILTVGNDPRDPVFAARHAEFQAANPPPPERLQRSALCQMVVALASVADDATLRRMAHAALA